MKKEDAVRCSTPILKTLLYSTESDAPTQFFSYTGNNTCHWWHMFHTLILALLSFSYFFFFLFTILLSLFPSLVCGADASIQLPAEHDGCISMIVDENIMPLFPSDETVQRLEEPWRVIQIDIGSSGIPCTFVAGLDFGDAPCDAMVVVRL
jgi:hypothetical protein